MRDRSYPGLSVNTVWVIIVVNFILLIATMISSEIIMHLGLVPVLFLNRPWTIITSLFIHAGFWHFIVNMLTFYFFGTYLSRLVGQGMFLLVYLSGGILGNIFYLLLGEPISIAVGASGAVFALAGVLVVMMPKLRVLVFPLPMPLPLWAAVIGIFIILSILGASDITPIAWEAHFGGLVAGLTAGFYLRKGKRYYYFR